MILHSTRPAVFVLAMDDCEVQASSGGLPNFCSVLWKNSDGPEALAQDRPLFQHCCWQLDLYEEDPSNLLVQAYDGGCAMPPLCMWRRCSMKSITLTLWRTRTPAMRRFATPSAIEP